MGKAGGDEAIAAVRGVRSSGASGVPSGVPFAPRDGGPWFGPAGMNLQSSVDVSDIDDSDEYLIELAIRSRDRLQRAVRHSSGASQAHYMALLMRLNVALKDKL
jgi:hypothetical protein